MDLKALQDALWSIWVVPSSGLPAASVYFGTQDAPNGPLPCIAIQLGGPQRRGMDQVNRAFDADAAPGHEIIYTVSGPRELMVTLQAFATSADALQMENDARALLSRVDASLALPNIREALNALKIGVLKQGSVRWVPGVQRAGWEGRAVLETLLCVSETVQGSIGYIQTVKGTYTVNDEAPTPYTLDLED